MAPGRGRAEGGYAGSIQGSVGGARAGTMAAASACRPREARNGLAFSGSVIVSTSLNVPPQRGQVVTSMANARRIRSAQRCRGRLAPAEYRERRAWISSVAAIADREGIGLHG